MRHKESKLFVVNNLLLSLIILVNLYVIAVPLLPQLFFHFNKAQGQEQTLQTLIHKPPTPTEAKVTNRLVVPSMLLDQPVVEGVNMYKALDQGIWRWPGGGTPDQGSNTVLVGHRFTYTKPKGVFYFLNKVKVGDSIGLIWGGKTYTYRVYDVSVVKPTQTSILTATDEPTLTMYTCTPLWLPKDRLVVTAHLEASYE